MSIGEKPLGHSVFQRRLFSVGCPGRCRAVFVAGAMDYPPLAGGGGGAEHSAAGWADCPNLVFPSGVFPFLWDCFTYRRNGNLRNPGRWDSLWPNMSAGCACVLPPWNEWFAAEGSFCAKGWKTVPPMDDLPFASESLCGFGSKGCSEAVGNGAEHVCDAIQLKNRACFFLHEQV